MKKLVAALALMGIVGGSVWYNIHARRQPPVFQMAPADNSLKEGISVTVTTARRQSSRQSITLTGVFKSDQQASISSRIPQKISSILVREGDRVQKGDPLVQLDIADAASTRTGALAGVEAAQANHRKSLDGRRAKITEMDGRRSRESAVSPQALTKLIS